MPVGRLITGKASSPLKTSPRGKKKRISATHASTWTWNIDDSGATRARSFLTPAAKSGTTT